MKATLIAFFLWLALAPLFAEAYNESPSKERILIDSVPANLDTGQVFDVLSKVFYGRQWHVSQRTAEFVVGQLDHNGYKCRLVVRHKGNQLVYVDETLGLVRAETSGGGPHSFRKGSRMDRERAPKPTPQRWLSYLRYDLGRALRVASLSASQQLRAPEDPAERLRKLEQLHKDGLITAEEYEAKRDAIVGEL